MVAKSNLKKRGVFFFFFFLFLKKKKKKNHIVMVSWFLLVLILNSCYTTSLSSMFTVKQLQPNVTDIMWLKKNNMKIGCDGDSYVKLFV